MSRDVVVSCVMPTRDRRAWVPLALRCWLEQDMPGQQRELVVIDDGPDPVADLLLHQPGVRYVYLEGQHSIGAKINLGCEMAVGDVIALWADDDWHAPRRLSYQMDALTAAGAAICGCDSMLAWDACDDEMWLYQFVPGRRTTAYVCGGTMMFRRPFWEERPFDHGGDGEDTRFVMGRTPVLGTLDYEFYVATQHGRNTAPKARAMRQASGNWRALTEKIDDYAASWWAGAVRKLVTT